MGICMGCIALISVRRSIKLQLGTFNKREKDYVTTLSLSLGLALLPIGVHFLEGILGWPAYLTQRQNKNQLVLIYKILNVV